MFGKTKDSSDPVAKVDEEGRAKAAKWGIDAGDAVMTAAMPGGMLLLIVWQNRVELVTKSLGTTKSKTIKNIASTSLTHMPGSSYLLRVKSSDGDIKVHLSGWMKPAVAQHIKRCVDSIG